MAATCRVLGLLLLALLGRGGESALAKGLAAIKPADTLKTVRILASDRFEGRGAGYRGCWEAGEWIARRLRALGLKPAGEDGTYFQRFTFRARGSAPPRGKDKRGKKARRTLPRPKPLFPTPTTRNVLALWEGRDPQRRNEVVIIGGHYDHVGRDGQWNGVSRRGGVKKGDDIWNGADDNASGTAAVLAVARAFAVSGYRPRRSILFVFFSAEEHGLYGSRWYCDHPVAPLAKTVVMFNLDMVGYRHDHPFEVAGVDHAAGGVLRRAVATAMKKVPGFKGELKPWAARKDSDHAPFIAHRIPAVFFFSGLHKDYHTVDDEADKISGARIAACARVVFLAAAAMADLPRKPAFVPGRAALSPAARLGLILGPALDRAARRKLHLGRKRGALPVRGVRPKSPADRAGVRPGDILIGVGRERFRRGRELAGLTQAVRKLRPGFSVSFRVVRKGKRLVLKTVFMR